MVLKQRPVGATASLGITGYPRVRSATGGEITLSTAATQPGFDPVDLLLASLAACISMSVRIAARRLNHAERFEGVTVGAAAEKSPDGSHRIEAFTVRIALAGPFSADEIGAIATMAEEICTVSNALTPRPRVLAGGIGEQGISASPSATS